MAKDSRIGVVGVGGMGANMARRLKEQGFVISAVQDRHPPFCGDDLPFYTGAFGVQEYNVLGFKGIDEIGFE